ncbi:uncharacterized protein B0H64DRAFT_409910 [Chaetomium fimeti]|uniref:Protein kinase domain-containing protein n=1 Tax=Chaetomium fimeti TaxID=1854472 RepID=A0AAE0LN94_9PEZI|nr:hypothetical protein B0H64DRAFT_409910 [Chaetomium fimeti]
MNPNHDWNRGGTWSPPTDAEKPLCPYKPGFTVDIKEHVPPPPFGTGYYPVGDWPYDRVTDAMLRSITQTELVMTNPPRECKPMASSFAPALANLTITEGIAIKDGRGSQLALCRISPKSPGQQPFSAVAKIFDPLYYSFRDKVAPSNPTDVTFDAEVDYCSEAAAYEHLRRGGRTGSFAPSYYGSWTFTLPIRHEGVVRQRQVRMVLIEHINGVCLHGLCWDKQLALRCHESYRLGVLAAILDAYVKLMHAGVEQMDLAPRNVILAPGPQDTSAPQPIPRVVIIDYAWAVVYHRAKEEVKSASWQAGKFPRNPMGYFWNYPLDDFGYWIPSAWDENRRRKQEWLMKEFGGRGKPTTKLCGRSLTSLLHRCLGSEKGSWGHFW